MLYNIENDPTLNILLYRHGTQQGFETFNDTAKFFNEINEFPAASARLIHLNT